MGMPSPKAPPMPAYHPHQAMRDGPSYTFGETKWSFRVESPRYEVRRYADTRLSSSDFGGAGYGFLTGYMIGSMFDG